MKKFILLFFVIITSLSFGQSLNDFKYALVPSKFSFLKEPNMYRLNNLSKLFMEKYGFETYLDTDSQPSDFENINCNKVFVEVVDNSGTFTTKVTVNIKDCKGKILYTSKEGSSRDKVYAVAYNDAFRQAFGSMSVLNHKYVEKNPDIVAENKLVVSKPEIITNQIFIKQYTVIATKNGFNLLSFGSNSEVFQIFLTSQKDVFIAKRNEISGVLIKKTDNWFFEYYENDKLVSERVEVKF